MSTERPIRVLVIDDSAANRRALTTMLELAPGIVVIERAGDGEDGLKKALTLRPDVITLDLEMPKLDGHAFLRLLMAQAPMPVIVISSYAHPKDVFQALKRGAVDFIAKPSASSEESLESLRAELVEKVRAAASARVEAPAPALTPPPRRPTPVRGEATRGKGPPLLLVVGASTGGPPAVQQLLEAVEHLPVAVLVAQHMPAHFTQAFAERLDHMLDLTVREAKGGETPEAGHVYLAPGGAQLELGGAPGAWRVWVSPRDASDKFAPSVDRLFRSAARTAAADATAVVLTGMGNDGAEGVKALAQAGAEIWAEDEASAVVFGMPGAAIATGCVQHVFPLERLRTGVAEALLARARRRGGA